MKPVAAIGGETRDPNAPLRVAVIGAGHLGRIHAKLLAGRDDVRVVAVCDPYAPSRDWIESNLSLPTCEAFSSLEGLIDAAIIATPTTLHAQPATWCLQRGIHCLIEKPIASTLIEAHQLQRLALQSRCCLQIGHVERFNPVWESLLDRVASDRVLHLDARREGVYTGRSTDIGIVLDLMIHDLDLILSLIDSPVQSIRATGRCVLGQHEDFAIADLVFENGVTAHLRASRISPAPVRTMEVHGVDAWHTLDFANSVLTSTCATEAVAAGDLQADTLPIEARLAVKDELFSRWLEQTETRPASANAIAGEHTDFVDSILSGRSPRVSGADGVRALEVACAITDQIAEQVAHHRGIIPASRLAAARRRAG